MATISTIADDFDGSTPAETVYFTVSGKEYAIDLNEEHRAELEEVLDAFAEQMRRYTDAARPMGKATSPRATSSRSGGAGRKSGTDTKAVRAWAQENGYEVGDRGRIPAEIVEAYTNRGVKKG